MKALIQRVSRASVSVDEKEIASIDRGLLALIGIERTDNDVTVSRMLERLLRYRVFADAEGKMNLSLSDVGGGLLLVPQFTLVADTGKGLRPSFSKGATPESGFCLFALMMEEARSLHTDVSCGKFGADMEVSLVNDGPVTFLLEM